MGWPRSGVAAAAALTLTLISCGCSADPGGSAEPATRARTATASPAPPGPTQSDRSTTGPSPSARGTATAARPNPGRTVRRKPPPVSLAAYFSENRPSSGRDLRLGAMREQSASYTSYDASYRSDGLLVTGVLNVPTGRGRFPAVVLAHGYIDPDYYTRGQGMTRERGVLASRGYVAFHVDYRAHGSSEGSEQGVERRVRLGYVADVLNAASALRAGDRVPVDDDRIALFGRSMGGGVTMRALAAAPAVFGAGVVWASVSSREDDNFNQWTRSRRPEVARYIAREHGLPGTPRGREFWPLVSARPHFDRVTAPLLQVHGGADDTCPPVWARESHRALRRAGGDSTLAWYPQEQHAFGPRFLDAMDRTIDFLDRRLR